MEDGGEDGMCEGLAERMDVDGDSGDNGLANEIAGMGYGHGFGVCM